MGEARAPTSEASGRCEPPDIEVQDDPIAKVAIDSGGA
jgi:hypothetical protein